MLLKLLIAADGKERGHSDTVMGIMCRIVVAIRMVVGCCENMFEAKEHRIIAFFLELARHSDTFKTFNDIVHDADGKGVGGRAAADKYSERLRKDSRVLLRVSTYFEEAITLEFEQWKTEDIQTPFHRERAIKLVREPLRNDDFEIPPPRLNGRYLGYSESAKQEV